MATSQLHGVPLETHIRVSGSLPIRSVKSATEVRVGAARRTVMGFSLCLQGEALHGAVARSQYEVLERVFALPELYGAGLERPVWLRRWDQEGPARPATAREVCQRPGGDSTGLAIHTCPQTSAQHAVMELLERHVLGQIWYARSLAPMVSCRESVSPNMELVTLGVAGIPLVVVVARSTTEPWAFCGSALRLDPASARLAARREALMLVDGHLEADVGVRGQRSTRRLAALSRNGAQLCAPLLQAPAGERAAHADAADLVRNVLGQAGVYVGTVQVRPGLYLSRACSDAAVTLPMWRSRQGIEDPFC
jgi:hypothetical protein